MGIFEVAVEERDGWWGMKGMVMGWDADDADDDNDGDDGKDTRMQRNRTVDVYV